MKREILFAWLSYKDLQAAESARNFADGPIARALSEGKWDEAVLLSNLEARSTQGYLKWLDQWTTTPVVLHRIELSSPSNYGEIHEAASGAVIESLGKEEDDSGLTFHLSPGTSAMVLVWVLLAKTSFQQARLIESSSDHQISEVVIPFDISADFLPDMATGREERLAHVQTDLTDQFPEFDQLVYRCTAMKRLVSMARQVARRDLPVLIQGASGTGKELLARAIHQSSARNKGPFIAVNCGAISESLVESELFGHEKGAFTGAIATRAGHFEAASGGTIFLDEVGDLQPSVQVKLLRVLQEKAITPVGSSVSRTINVRIISATNRNLHRDTTTGRFREDLFHRIAVAVLFVPSLRDRKGDLSLLIDHLLSMVNQEFSLEPGFKPKALTASARNLLLAHPWPGNIRELLNTLRRAVLWANGDTIKAKDAESYLLTDQIPTQKAILNRSLDEDFSLPETLSEVADHYLSLSLQQADNNKAKAARLLGLPNTTTFNNWLKKHPWSFKKK